MYCQTPDVIRVGFDRRHFLASVVVEHSEVEIVGSTHEPVLASDEFDTSYGYFSYFESLDHGLRKRGERSGN